MEPMWTQPHVDAKRDLPIKRTGWVGLLVPADVIVSLFRELKQQLL